MDYIYENCVEQAHSLVERKCNEATVFWPMLPLLDELKKNLEKLKIFSRRICNWSR